MHTASEGIWQSVAVIAALLPAVLQAWRPAPGRDRGFWLALAAAVLAPAAWVLVQTEGGWHSGFTATMWAATAATLALFAVLTFLFKEIWRLLSLLAAYMMVYAGLAVTAQIAGPAQDGAAAAAAGWMQAHIVVALLTYGLITLAAVAAYAAFLQERALKRKRPHRWTRVLPSLADCDALQLALLRLGGGVLGIGLATGAAIEYLERGRFFDLSHKTLLTSAAFLVILGLLWLRHREGTRGRRAARLVLLSYLLLTLGYPGVKFVTDVLMAGQAAG